MRPAFCWLMLLCAGCGQAPLSIHKFDKPLMHTRWDFSVAASSESKARAAVELAAAEIARLDKALAMWRPESELAAFNAKAGQGPQKVGPDLDAVLSLGLEASELSQGASDCTVGPLVQLWYGHLQAGRLPPPSEIAAAKKLVDYRRLKREGQGLWSAQPGTRADLGSFAKGYAQDKAAAIFRKRGLRHFLMNAGGQVYASGHKPGGASWAVGVIHPRDPSRVVAVMKLKDEAMSTSGDYEQSTPIKGRRYHHIIDPRSGRPVSHGTASVTVILPLGHPAPAAWCDALDTAALVMGMEKGRRLLEGRKASGILIKADSRGKLEAAMTEDLEGKVELALE